MRIVFAVIWAGLASIGAWAQPPAARAIHEKFAAAKPTAEQLAFFGLDWAPDLTAAKARSAKEKRPIALLTVHNITSACNFFSGHI